MKDVTNREIKPGTFVLYIEKEYFNTRLSPAMILKINQRSLRASVYGHDRIKEEYCGIVKRIPIDSDKLYVIDNIPNLSGNFKEEVAEIVKYCLENEKLPAEVRENCIYLLGALA